MFETDIITADERVELIDGQVIPMSAKNPPHAATTLCASDYLKRWRSLPQASLAEVVLVRMQDPIQLSQYSEPEPDIAVVQVVPLPVYFIYLKYVVTQAYWAIVDLRKTMKKRRRIRGASVCDTLRERRESACRRLPHSRSVSLEKDAKKRQRVAGFLPL